MHDINCGNFFSDYQYLPITLPVVCFTLQLAEGATAGEPEDDQTRLGTRLPIKEWFKIFNSCQKSVTIKFIFHV